MPTWGNPRGRVRYAGVAQMTSYNWLKNNADPFSRLVAEELAKFHEASIQGEVYTDRSGDADDFNWYEAMNRKSLQGLKEYAAKGEHSDMWVT